MSNVPSDTSNQQVSYEGDLIDLTATPLKENFQKLDFLNPAELLAFYDPYISEGQTTLYRWQTELHEHLGSIRPTSLQPHKFCLVAANGSGKDAFIAAPFCVWFALSKIQSRCILTSSSGTQLTSQTEPAIRRLCELVNSFHGQEIFRIRQRYIKCRLTGSEIRMFATDEAGKAEGYHPIVPGGEMAVLINEAKSVSEEIYLALRRCTGYNYWIEYSSPGEQVGFFYRDFCVSNLIDLDKLETIIGKRGKYAIRVTSYDCPAHLSDEDREDDKRDLGEHSALFRSKHLALFTSISGEVIITSELLDKLIQNPPLFNIAEWPDRIGIDLAAGGDENVICFTRGNRVKKLVTFRETDTTITADRIEAELNSFGIKKDHDHIYADDGGVGHSIIDMLVRKGWKIKRIMNQWAAFNKKQFGNRGAENWHRVKRIFEELLFDISNTDIKMRDQLITRRYKQGLVGARIFLESKREAKANGRPSPDRADALILSLTGLTVDDFIKARPIELDKSKTKTGELVLASNEIDQYYSDNYTFGLFEGKNPMKNRNDNKKINGSLQVALSKQNLPTLN